MDRVWPAVAGALGNRLRLNHLDDFRLSRVGLGVDDVNARGAETGNNKVAALEEGMGCVGRQASTTGVPAVVVQLIADVGQLHPAYQSAVGG